MPINIITHFVPTLWVHCGDNKKRLLQRFFSLQICENCKADQDKRPIRRRVTVKQNVDK